MLLEFDDMAEPRVVILGMRDPGMTMILSLACQSLDKR